MMIPTQIYNGKRQAGSKLALALLLLVILEIVLIGHQVESVKSIKKKILLKKLKKMIPFFALIKPKKKILLLPIPVPMFKNPSMNTRPNLLPVNGYRTVNPNSVMILDTVPMAAPSSSMMMVEPSNMTYEMISPSQSPPISTSGSGVNVMPTVTMTISSASAPIPEASLAPAIELNTNMNMPQVMVVANASQPMSAPLVQHPTRTVNCHHQHHQLRYVEPLDQYEYETRNKGVARLVARRPAPISPANRFRSERYTLKGGQLVSKQQPIVTINHNWRQAPARLVAPISRAPIVQQQDQSEQEQWVPAGPPQLIPVYQTANGGLHLTPPTNQDNNMRSFDVGNSFEVENSASNSRPESEDPNREVHLINSSQDSSAPKIKIMSTESSFLGGTTISPAESRSSPSMSSQFASGRIQNSNSYSTSGPY